MTIECETCASTGLVRDSENGSGGLDCPDCNACKCARTPMLDLSRGTDQHEDDCPWLLEKGTIAVEPYYTIFVPFVPYKLATEWHPTTAEGPFSTLTRGNFKTYEDAIAWGKAHLDGTPYTIKLIDDNKLIQMDPSGLITVTKFRVELLLPGIDSSELLERMQALAVELAEEFNDEIDDDNYTSIDLDAIESAVSVQVAP